MRICIVGAGAVGGLLGIHLCAAGHEVSFVARGVHLEAMRTRGAKLVSYGRETVVHPACSDDPAYFGPQDYVVVTVKAPSQGGILPRIAPLLGPDTPVVLSTNGLPWWFTHGVGGPLEGRRLRSIDPDGALARSVQMERVLGCVVNAGCSVLEPGVIAHVGNRRFFIGELAGGASPRVRRLTEAISAAGLEGIAHERIHDEVWQKLLGNMPMAPIAALTGGSLRDILGYEPTRELYFRLQAEGDAVGRRLGLKATLSREERLALAEKLGDFKPSMLQDLTLGRPMEIDDLVTVVVELAEIAGVAVPTIENILALVRLRATLAGLYPSAVAPAPRELRA
jgi:2-dehydropantoate 2-reductase